MSWRQAFPRTEMTQKTLPQSLAMEGPALGMLAYDAVVCGELGTRSPIYQRGNGGWEKGSDSQRATQPGRAGTRLRAGPRAPGTPPSESQH